MIAHVTRRRPAAAGVLAAAALAVALVVPAAPATAEPLPDRTVDTEVVVTELNRLVLKGDVDPGHAQRPVLIQKRNCAKPRCRWHQYDVVRSDDDGRFRARIAAPRRGSDFFRAKVRAHGDYGTSYSQVWRTWTD